MAILRAPALAQQSRRDDVVVRGRVGTYHSLWDLTKTDPVDAFPLMPSARWTW